MLRRGSLAVPATVLLLACGTDLIEGTTGGLTGDDTASTGKTTPTSTPTGGETGEPTGGSMTGGETGEPTGGSTGGVATGTTAQDTTGEPAATGTTGDEASGSDTTGAESGESGTGMPALCGENHVIKRAPTEATLSGAWVLDESLMGEGTIVRHPFNDDTDGAVVWDVPIPCTATWHVWVRYWDEANFDSYLVQLDQQPEPAAIFEGACTPGGYTWGWRQLNWRDPVGGSNCQYVLDPWTADWDTGTHQIAFRYHESSSLGRIIVTNDAAFVPGMGD